MPSEFFIFLLGLGDWRGGPMRGEARDSVG